MYFILQLCLHSAALAHTPVLFAFSTPHLILFIPATLSRESNRKLDVLDFYSRVSAPPAGYLSILALCKFVFMQRSTRDDETVARSPAPFFSILFKSLTLRQRTGA
jgi:hypothetical protein